MSDINKCLAACQEYRNKLDKLEAENAKLRNELARVNNQTNWECTCGGTDCAGQKENAALRADKERLDSGTILLTVDGERVHHVGVNLRSAIDAARKEAQP